MCSEINNDYYSNNPNDKCGYESIWIGLKCKKSDLLEKYKLQEMTDLYKLFRNGNDEYPELFENENVKKFIESKGEEFKKLCLEFKNERLKKNKDGVWEIFPLLASLYLEIKLSASNNDDRKKNQNRLLEKTLEDYDIKPKEELLLEYSPLHVEYKPLEIEQEIYENEKKKLNIKKETYLNLHINLDDLYDNDFIKIDYNDLMEDFKAWDEIY